MRKLCLLLLLALCGTTPGLARISPFIVKPYLQIGRDPAPSQLTLLWTTADVDAAWEVQVSPATSPRTTVKPSMRRYQVMAAPCRAFVAVLDGLVPGRPFDYVVLRDGRRVFTASGTAPPAAGDAAHVVLYGDTGDGSGSERAIAQAVYREHPGLVVIAGDIVYPQGTELDYEHNFFPVYNSERAVAGQGVPLMRSVPFVAAPGNHDVPAGRGRAVNLGRMPDALAYYYDWMQPLNGPLVPSTRPKTIGPTSRLHEFLAAAGANFPRMGSFSFDWGAIHWLVLDSNPYVDWTDENLRHWIERDLAAAKGAAWRFVVFHHTPFQSAYMKTQDQWMRLLHDVFEQGHVDVVFAGHLHNYQRNWPLHFVPRRGPDGRFISRNLSVNGIMRIDHAFDGASNTHPDGIIYITSGGGGAPLSNSKRTTQPRRWQPYTCRYIADTWSFTDIHVDATRAVVRQVGLNGDELDRFVITRP